LTESGTTFPGAQGVARGAVSISAEPIRTAAVSWTAGTSPNADLVNGMLDLAAETLEGGERPVIHSDRGCHYRWPGWIERAEKAGLTRSMSNKGCSPDNSACEGFFGRLKNEMFYGRPSHDVSVDGLMDALETGRTEPTGIQEEV